MRDLAEVAARPSLAWWQISLVRQRPFYNTVNLPVLGADCRNRGMSAFEPLRTLADAGRLRLEQVQCGYER